MKKFKIYQLPIKHAAKFMGLDFVKECNCMPLLSDYNLVYEGSVEPMMEWSDMSFLERLFRTFNIGRKPADYRGHSLSVSDVVEFDGKYFYCDSYGWEEVSFQL